MVFQEPEALCVVFREPGALCVVFQEPEVLCVVLQEPEVLWVVFQEPEALCAHVLMKVLLQHLKLETAGRPGRPLPARRPDGHRLWSHEP